MHTLVEPLVRSLRPLAFSPLLRTGYLALLLPLALFGCSSNNPRLVQDWTTDRRAMSRAIARVSSGGGTAMYDAVASALPIASTGSHTKNAMVIISDGNDTNSALEVRELRQMIRESEVLVYALGVDGTESRNTPTVQLPIPFPIPGTGRRSPPVFGGGVRRVTKLIERLRPGAALVGQIMSVGARGDPVERQRLRRVDGHRVLDQALDRREALVAGDERQRALALHEHEVADRPP